MAEIYLPPNSQRVASQAENSLAGCLLVDPETTFKEIQGLVKAGNFQSDMCRAVFIATASLVSCGKPCDPVLIQAEAARLGQILDDSFCAEVMQLYTTTANVAATAEIVRDAARSRKAREIGNSLLLGELTPLEGIAKLQELLRDSGTSLHSPLEAANAFADYVSAVSEGKYKPFLSTGFASMDRILSGGLIESGLIVLAARPGVGKTTAALNVADNVAATGKVVLYISLEMSERQLWARRVAILSGLSYSDIYAGRINELENEWKRFMSSTDALSQRPFYIKDTPATLEEVESEARSVENLSLLVIDHLSLIRQQTGKRSLSRYELMTDTTHRLKQLAMSLHIPVLALCQLNRASEMRRDKHPTMADLRDSGAIEEDADAVILLFRANEFLDESKRPKPWERQDLDFIIAKNRHGMTGSVGFDFWGINARIRERQGYEREGQE